MARYVKEFANATMLAEKYVKRCPEAGKMNERIRRIVKNHKKGMITDFEAVKEIVNAKEESERISAAKELWVEFGEISMNPETECIEEEWHGFSAGTFREDIWHWFEETFNVSVAEDLMGLQEENSMKKYSIWKTNGKNDMFCCQIEAKGEISALKKYAKNILSSGERWIDKEQKTLHTSYGEEYKAVETI